MSLLETPCSIFRCASERTSALARRQRIGSLALVLVKDDDPALAPRLGGHHRELGACDELAWVRGVLRPNCDPDRKSHRADGVERRECDALRNPVRKRVGDLEISRRDDDRELLATCPADVITLADGGAQLDGELGEYLIANSVAVDVIDPLEVVEVEHEERDGAALGRRSDNLSSEPLVECAVIPETRQRIRLRLKLERGPDLGVVERKSRGVTEADGELELLVGELGQADPVDVERALDAAARDQRHGEERLRIGRRALDEPDARIEIGAVCEDGLAVLDGPPGDSLPEGEWLVGDHLVGVVAAGEDTSKFPLSLVCLVEGQIVMGDQIAEGVRDSLEQRIERLLGEDVVEDVCEATVRVDESECRGGAGVANTYLGRRHRTGVGRRSHGDVRSSADDQSGLSARGTLPIWVGDAKQ